jgi:anti-sigma B factor antagonist
MSAKLSTRQVGDVTILEVSGRITLGEGSSMFREELRRLLAQGHKKILVDLGATSYADSSGIGELVSGSSNVWNQGGQIKLCHLTGRVKDLLIITKFFTVWDSFDDEAEAIASFDKCPTCGQNAPTK